MNYVDKKSLTVYTWLLQRKVDKIRNSKRSHGMEKVFRFRSRLAQHHECLNITFSPQYTRVEKCSQRYISAARTRFIYLNTKTTLKRWGISINIYIFIFGYVQSAIPLTHTHTRICQPLIISVLCGVYWRCCLVASWCLAPWIPATFTNAIRMH